MTTPEFKRAFQVAASDTDLSNEDIMIFDGYGLGGFLAVVATIRQVARLIRWQARNLNGTFDAEELTSIQARFRHRVTVVG